MKQYIAILIMETLFLSEKPEWLLKNPLRRLENLKAAKKPLRLLENLKVCRKTLTFSQEPQKTRIS